MANDEGINDRIDDAVLALLYLNICERYPLGGARSWKSLDWDALDRLHDRDLISNPVGKAKSVVLTDEGLELAESAFNRLFRKGD